MEYILATLFLAFNAYQDTKEFIDLYIEEDKQTADKYLHYILFFKGIFLASIPAALATYSLKISRAYIHERLKRQERKHAINFGRFYLKKEKK